MNAFFALAVATIISLLLTALGVIAFFTGHKEAANFLGFLATFSLAWGLVAAGVIESGGRE